MLGSNFALSGSRKTVASHNQYSLTVSSGSAIVAQFFKSDLPLTSLPPSHTHMLFSIHLWPDPKPIGVNGCISSYFNSFGFSPYFLGKMGFLSQLFSLSVLCLTYMYICVRKTFLLHCFPVYHFFLSFSFCLSFFPCDTDL